MVSSSGPSDAPSDISRNVFVCFVEACRAYGHEEAFDDLPATPADAIAALQYYFEVDDKGNIRATPPDDNNVFVFETDCEQHVERITKGRVVEWLVHLTIMSLAGLEHAGKKKYVRTFGDGVRVVRFENDSMLFEKD